METREVAGKIEGFSRMFGELADTPTRRCRAPCVGSDELRRVAPSSEMLQILMLFLS